MQNASAIAPNALQRGLNYLLHQDWHNAENCFLEALAQQPSDERVSDLQ
jgi:Tfp pilus assembly protein PilF